ncbi:MAG: BolA family transcriptional regulator [Sphingobacteriia bacterium]|nr:BolA family transcriptional regulator [Sphingobacteriia bacterium]NCC38863.1 BolA family transcriptional regulator [Gammaproteobacteria bacterium]
MSRKDRITDILTRTFQPMHLEVLDESHMHAVAPGAESHFRVLVVSESFVDTGLLARHRLVNRVLDPELGAGLHALALHTWTPEEWFIKGGQAPESPPCQGGARPLSAAPREGTSSTSQ